MIRLFLEGVYNHGEVIWLELKWFVLSLLRVRIYSQMLDDLHWVEVMPSQMLVKFCSWRTTIIWKYSIENNKLHVYKGWNITIINDSLNTWMDSYPFILTAHNKYVYEALDKILS